MGSVQCWKIVHLGKNVHHRSVLHIGSRWLWPLVVGSEGVHTAEKGDRKAIVSFRPIFMKGKRFEGTVENTANHKENKHCGHGGGDWWWWSVATHRVGRKASALTLYYGACSISRFCLAVWKSGRMGIPSWQQLGSPYTQICVNKLWSQI